ncbi:hypothetical protein [Yoonia sp.]|uniref:hypothetical protein n=1 Tax=Yoonia sp. TaxID=2212373 RepID=UPI00391C9D54
MPFEWPNAEQMTYRLWRLRRLWAFCALLPMVVITAVWLAGNGPVPVHFASLAIVGIAALVTLHIVLFPNVADETMALSAALTGLVCALPFLRDLGALAPVEHAQSAMVLGALAGLIGTGLAMALLAPLLKLLSFAGPVIRRPIHTQIDLACSVSVARQQYALQPQTRRGRILTGQADAQGLFDVAICSGHEIDPDAAEQPLVARVTAKILQSGPDSHAVMLLLPCGSLSVSAFRFIAHPGGCRVQLSEIPGDFTPGMYLHYWLTDQQGDTLTEVADRITGRPERANGLAHGVSFLSLAGLVLSPSEPVADRAK